MIGQTSFFDAVLGLAVLLVSIVIHENAHGVAALALGDDTARKAGRITLNPIPHLDLVGSVIVPVAMYFSIGTMFGYAKPVPVTPSKLRGTDRTGFALVAAAGPASNLLLAVIASALQPETTLIGGTSVAANVLGMFVAWNVFLAAFNLLPIPPLDGSRFLRLFLTARGRQVLDRFEPFGFLVLFLVIFMLGEPLQRLLLLIVEGFRRILPI